MPVLAIDSGLFNAHDTFLLMAISGVELGLFDDPKKKRKRPGTRGVTIKRIRRPVTSILYELGGYSRRFYRMFIPNFWKLLSLLQDQIAGNQFFYNEQGDRVLRRQPGSPPNGRICESTRLSCAIISWKRPFAQGYVVENRP